MMQAKIKKAWLEALRSGEYSQAQHALVKFDGNGEPEGYCCLGVLLDVSIKQGFLPDHRLAWDDDQVLYDYPHGIAVTDDFGDDIEGSATDGQLGPDLCEYFGIDPRIESDLINKNDSGADFLHIAEYIQEVL